MNTCFYQLKQRTPILFCIAILFILQIFITSCNNGDKKKSSTGGSENEVTDTSSLNSDTTSNLNKLNTITIRAEEDSNATFSVLDLAATATMSSVKTYIFKIPQKDLRKILQFNTRRQIRFYFYQKEDASFALLASGHDKDGNPRSKEYVLEELKDTTINQVALRTQNLRRGVLRKFLHPGSKPGDIDNSKIVDLYLTPYVNAQGLIEFYISKKQNIKKPISPLDVVNTNPIPPTPPACGAECDN